MCTRAWGGGVGSGAGKAIGPAALPILLTEKRRGKNRNNFMGFAAVVVDFFIYIIFLKISFLCTI